MKSSLEILSLNNFFTCSLRTTLLRALFSKRAQRVLRTGRAIRRTAEIGEKELLMKKLWFVIRRGSRIRVVPEKEVGDYQVITQPFDNKSEATKWASNYIINNLKSTNSRPSQS